MKHYNPTFSETAGLLFNTKSGDHFGSEVLPYITPVAVLDPICRISRNASATNATSATVYAVPSDKDFYITAISLSLIKDATSTSTASTITATIDGVAQVIVAIAGLTLTAQSNTVTQQFVRPLKIDKGTNIIVTNTTATANVTANACMQGYEVLVARP